MPIITSSYNSPLWLPDRHSQTIVPSLFRKVPGVNYTRERIPTPDKDFLDLDWSCQGNNRLAIIAHGMEGCSTRPYVLGMTQAFNEEKWDTLSWNFRCCSGETNLQLKFYNAGSSGDLACVADHVVKTKTYKEIVLVGFSLGGNIILKYLEEYGGKTPSEISKAIVFSVTGDLYSCVQELSKGFNRVYLARFLITLKQKMIEKGKDYPELLKNLDWSQIQSLIDFDNRFTAPLGGFRDAHQYYEECSSKYSIPEIRIPVLIVNSLNDPFLNSACYPINECAESAHVFLELPANGGHIGFPNHFINGRYWTEDRTIAFVNN